MTDPKPPRSPGSPFQPVVAGATRPAERSSSAEQGASGAPAPRLRPPLPTLVELGQVSATETLRPPGAVPPPPRGVPLAPRSATGRPAAPASTPSPDDRESVPATTPAPLAAQDPIPRTDRRGSDGRRTREPVLPAALAPPRVPALSEARISVEPNAPIPAAQEPFLPRRPPWLLRSLGAAAVAGLLLVGWRFIRPESARSAAKEDASSVPADAKPAPVLPCAASASPRKLADSVHLPVAPLVQADPGGRILLAYAATPTEAVGLTLDPLTLDAAKAYSETDKDKLLGVLPLAARSEGELFTTSRGSAAAGSLVQLTGGVAHLTVNASGIEVRLGERTHTGWPDLGAAKSSSPRLEALSSGGAILALRRGGLDGEVMVGLIDETGRPQQSPTRIISAAREFGTPSVTVGSDEVLVSFASKLAPDAPWRIELARAPLGQLPSASRAFVPAGLAADATNISPAAAALPGGGWLLQWTQGEGGKHRVWLQTLDRTLAPVGAPLTAGPAEGDSGQGTPWAGAEGRGASFYIVRSGQRWELWGTALQCPR